MKENMIKHLKRKMLLIIMTFVTIVIVGLVLVIVIVPVKQRKSEIRAFLTEMDVGRDMVKQEPPMKGPNLYLISNLATVWLDKEGIIVRWSSNREDLFDVESITQVAQRALSENKEFGKVLGIYYMRRKTPDGVKLLFLDDRLAASGNRQTAVMACMAGGAAWILLLVLNIWMVNRVVKPVGQAFEKQRQFISDASHELKTPIAVIEANASVLANEIGDNKWLSYIVSEASRMEQLVRDLMTLASMEESGKKSIHIPFNLSKTVLGALLPFESMAFEKNMVLESDITPNVQLKGDKEQIEQLVSIFLNNAIKYGEEQGFIRVKLISHQKKAILSIYNTGQGIAAEETNKIFERFYRTDKSRARNGNSYGLGLAIAKVIAEEHHTRIEVTGEQGKWVQFSVVFSL